MYVSECLVQYVLNVLHCTLSLSCSSTRPRCALSVSNGILAMKVENVNEVWTVPVALFSFLQVDSSPGLRRFSLPAGMGSANEIYDIAFQQSDAFGLVPGKLQAQRCAQLMLNLSVYVCLSLF